jgi:ribonuclease-3
MSQRSSRPKTALSARDKSAPQDLRLDEDDGAPSEATARTRLARRLAGFNVPPELLRQALSHRSFCAEAPAQASNERLELLGDAVLGLVITDHLYRSFPDLPEGDLARVKAAAVSMLELAPVAEALGLGEALLLGRGEESSGGRQKSSILADCLEAVIGAVYLAAGHEGASAWVLDLLGDHVTEIAAEARLGDPKNRLQELAAARGLGAPSYVVQERGPDHAKQFTAEALVAGKRLGSGAGRSKKDAERHAAEVALKALLEPGRGANGADDLPDA